jgi:hypothetical protein
VVCGSTIVKKFPLYPLIGRLLAEANRVVSKFYTWTINDVGFHVKDGNITKWVKDGDVWYPRIEVSHNKERAMAACEALIDLMSCKVFTHVLNDRLKVTWNGLYKDHKRIQQGKLDELTADRTMLEAFSDEEFAQHEEAIKKKMMADRAIFKANKAKLISSK